MPNAGADITADGLGSGATGDPATQATASDVKGVFRRTESAAMADSGVTSDTAKSRAMLVAGFDLITANCKDYFRNAGAVQHRLNTSRDVTVATASFLAAAMGLNPRNDEPIAALPLLTGGIYAGMDVYAKNYLFSAENIGAVEDLTINALKAHQAAQLRNVDAHIAANNVLSYGQVVDILQDNQAYCTPTRILPQVRDAIRNGKVVERDNFAPPPPSDARTTGQKNADAAILKEIGALYGLQGPISEEQALGYYWLYLHDSRDEDMKGIFDLLEDMPEPAKPLGADFQPRTTGYTKDAKLELALQRLSEPLVTQFKASIQAYREKVEAAATAPAPPPPPPGTPPAPELRPTLVSPGRSGGQPGGQGVLPPVVIEVR